MKTSKYIGLAFGKFAPFHKGHEFFLRQALRYVDKLIVLVYNHPELALPGAETRSRWIRNVMHDKRVRVIPADNTPPSGNSAMIMRQHNKYKARLLCSLRIDFVFCNEWYGNETARFFNAEHVTIDPERKANPVSGTLIRANLDTYADYLHPVVRKDLGL